MQLAVACAQDMRTAMQMLQKELPEPIAIGIGVNTGEAVVGNMGSVLVQKENNVHWQYNTVGVNPKFLRRTVLPETEGKNANGRLGMSTMDDLAKEDDVFVKIDVYACMRDMDEDDKPGPTSIERAGLPKERFLGNCVFSLKRMKSTFSNITFAKSTYAEARLQDAEMDEKEDVEVDLDYNDPKLKNQLPPSFEERADQNGKLIDVSHGSKGEPDDVDERYKVHESRKRSSWFVAGTLQTMYFTFSVKFFVCH